MSEKQNANGNEVHTRGRQRDILAYFWATPGRYITIAELEKKFKGQYDRRLIMSTMAHVCNKDMKAKYLYPIERVTQGVWKLSEPKGHEEVQADRNGETVQHGQLTKVEPGMMLVEILKERDTHLIVEDTENGKIYKMLLVG